jgi:hypothetical protein
MICQATRDRRVGAARSHRLSAAVSRGIDRAATVARLDTDDCS